MNSILQVNSYRCYLSTRIHLGWRWMSSNNLSTRRRYHASVKSRSRSNPQDMVGKLSVGDTLYGYTVEAVTSLPEFDAKAAQLIHNKTKASHLHIARSDSNNTFSVGFRTTPMDSTGVAHILEHTTLCGSKKFPVRDPFFKMLTRSLTSFMNAFTASDWTMYPFSSQNSKDFSNLLSVYLDCVFFPRLREVDFRQEGWRLEHENPQDPTSPIIFKGVVFNEMKGAFASPESVFVQALQNHLLPGHTYSHVSGGRPLDILDLTWDSLKKFHATHYHPTNAHFFTYGDMPLNDHLQYIDEKVLASFDRGPLSLDVPLEKRWQQPKTHRIHCAPDPMATDREKQTTVTVAFLQAPNTDPYEALVLSILGQLLVDGPSSPFYQALLDADIGSDYSPNTGYDNSTLDSFFCVGLQGIREEDTAKVEEIVLNTLETVSREGFPEERVRAVLHQVELGVKHQSSNFGLGLATSVISPWIHGGDPVMMLKINQYVQKFKDNMKVENYLQDKIKQYFLNNNHRLTLVMSPQEEYDSVLQSAEQKKLTDLVSSLSETDKQEVFRKGLELLEDQNIIGNDDCLPTVLLSDIDKEIRYTELNHQHSGGIPVQYTEQPTNGLTYFRGISSLSLIPDELKVYVPLFCSVITRMGAGDLDYRQFSLQCDLYSGGLNVSPHVCAHHSTVNGFDQGVLLSSHCLNRHVPHMFSLWEDVFTSPNLTDMERLKTLVRMSASSLAMSIANSGHSFAMTSSSSGLSPSAKLAELFNGMTQVQFLMETAQADDLTDVIQKFALIAAEILDCGSLRCAINTNPESFDQVQVALDGWIDTLPGSRADVSSYTEENEFSPTGSMVYYQMPFPVYYIGQSFRTVPFTHEDSPRLSVLARLMSSKFLHKEIREKGGAYGGGAVHQDGVFSFMSYRDPNCQTTMNTFKNSVEWASRGDFTEQDVTEALLSVFSKVDSPVSPGAKGTRTFLTGITDEMKQHYRQKLFNVKKKDMQVTAKKYLVNNSTQSCAVIGPKNEEVTAIGTQWTVNTFDL